MTEPAARLEALSATLKELQPELDEVARARIQVRLSEQIAADPAPPARARWRGAVWPAGVAALLAAAAALIVSVRGSTPRAPSPARPPAPAVYTDPAPAAAAPPKLELSPYALSGAAAAALVPLLGQPSERLEIPAGVLARAAIGTRARLSLADSARLDVVSLTPSRIELALTRGQLAIDYDSRQGGELVIRTPDARVRVVGTLLGVSIESGRTLVGVSHGAVEVEASGKRHLLQAEQAWQSGSETVTALPRELGRMLEAHATSLLPPPAAHTLLSVAGARSGMTARLGAQVLGDTPVWALVPIGAVEVSLSEADGAVPARPRAAPRDTAALLYERAERCLARGDRDCARRQLEALITRFPDSSEAEPALYELGQGAADCAAAVPWLERYLLRHKDGRFAAGARRRLTLCGAAPE